MMIKNFFVNFLPKEHLEYAYIRTNVKIKQLKFANELLGQVDQRVKNISQATKR